jgi:hypothetical protein
MLGLVVSWYLSENPETCKHLLEQEKQIIVNKIKDGISKKKKLYKAISIHIHSYSKRCRKL